MSITDSKDEQLVRLLAEDARQNSETLAKKLNISSATVRRRLRKLLRADVLRIVGVVNPSSFGLSLPVVIGLNVLHDKLKLAMKALAKQPEIKWLSTTTGRFDIIIQARFPSTEALSNFVTKELTELEGVKDSETFVCLDVKKGQYVQLD